MDDLWKALSARIETGPDLAAGGHIFRDCDDAGDMQDRDARTSALSVPRQRQRSTDETRGLGEPPARPAHPRFHDLAGVDYRLPCGETLAKAAADRERQ
jgi:hypothetical protein